MDKHTMQVLQDVTAHKEAIIQKVRQQIQQEPTMSKSKWTYRAVTMMITCSILFFIAGKPQNRWMSWRHRMKGNIYIHGFISNRSGGKRHSIQ